MNRIHVRGAAIALILAVGACDESPTNVGDLSQAEAEALAQVVGAQVMSSAFRAIPAPGAAAAGPAAATIQYSESVAFTGECELGGTIAVDADYSGSADDQTGEGSFSFSLTQMHDGCIGAADDGTVFTLYGAPSITAQFDIDVAEQMVALDGSFDGAVDWETDEGEGTCLVDVIFSFDLDGSTEAVSTSMSGNVCGVEFSRSVSVS